MVCSTLLLRLVEIFCHFLNFNLRAFISFLILFPSRSLLHSLYLFIHYINMLLFVCVAYQIRFQVVLAIIINSSNCYSYCIQIMYCFILVDVKSGLCIMFVVLLNWLAN